MRCGYDFNEKRKVGASAANRHADAECRNTHESIYILSVFLPLVKGGEIVDEIRAFWAVIPAAVLYDESIAANAKILYGEISAMTKKEGYCWASNAQLAEGNQWSVNTVSRLVGQLEKAGHIVCEYEKNEKTGATERKIYQSVMPTSAEMPRPHSPKMVRPPSSKKVIPSHQNCVEVHNNNKNKRGKGEKAAQAAAIRPALDDFFAEAFGEHPAVMAALKDMLDARAEKGDPMASLAAAKALRRNIEKYADDGDGFNADLAESLLLYSASRGYPSVYPPKEDVVAAARQKRQRSDDGGGVDLSGLVFV